MQWYYFIVLNFTTALPSIHRLLVSSSRMLGEEIVALPRNLQSNRAYPRPLDPHDPT